MLRARRHPPRGDVQTGGRFGRRQYLCSGSDGDAGRSVDTREAWNERIVLGMGVSHVPVVERRGHGYDRPVATMCAYLDDMDRAYTSWSGPAVEPPPRVLGALRPLMLRLAAERTAGAHPFFITVDHTRRARDVLGSQPLLATAQAVVLAQDRPTARAAGGDQHAARMLEFDAYRDNLRWLGWSDSDLAPPVSDRLFDAVIAWGAREAIWERVQEHLRAGADHVSLNLIGAATEAGICGRLEALLPIGV